ncbi:hypothetical protein C825_003916 [Parabacteroides sp. ASF519]|uniref:Uncharacterized protein n=1 Tax=Parabacteroides goldsteinii dnLKV18 TaxID=1235789 RepID=S0GQN3_9BACT|nr:hypothetical protein C803_01668 [Parabacteroides goldsteinii dnLKV18]KAI4361843.1 hypothetical protein C825_003916 [Parabacteroides sp. ASF519]
MSRPASVNTEVSHFWHRYPFLRSHSNNLFCPILIPFCCKIFANSAIKHERRDVDTASANNTLGASDRIFCSASIRFCCSSLRLVANWIRKSGEVKAFSNVVFVIYAPCLRMEGRTSLVTHLRKDFTFGDELCKITS